MFTQELIIQDLIIPLGMPSINIMRAMAANMHMIV